SDRTDRPHRALVERTSLPGGTFSMLDELIYYLTLGSALGSGLIAGAFFAFSTFVMRALSRLPANEGVAAMQSINVAVINPWFMLVFLGTGVACAALIFLTVLRWQKPG